MSASKPNVLVICSDQHNPLFTGYRDHQFVETPNLDKLAAEGTCFTRAYCNSPVCTPSRMSFITGKYVHKIGSWMIGVPLDPGEMTWARRLDQAGIPSTMFGKMDLCGPYQDGGFTDHRIIERRPAWAVYPRDTPYAPRLAGYVRPDKRLHLVNAGVRRKNPPRDDPGWYNWAGFYDHDRQVRDWALAYLRDRGREKYQDIDPSDGRSGWALYVGLLYPHWPYTVPEEYFARYYPNKLELPNEALFPNERLHPALRHFQEALGLTDVSEDMIRRTIAAYQGMVTVLDEMVGDILRELEAQGLAEDTYVVYTSDHGESLGNHGLFYKQCSYEGSVGVPLLIKGPAIPAGKVVDLPVSLVDLYPTVLDMVGLPVERDLPGASWLPLARGEPQNRPDYAFSEFHGNFFTHDWYMLVRDRYKYTYYVGERPSLFDIVADPLEKDDLASQPAYAKVLEEFEELLKTIVDPEGVARNAKRDLGLIGSNGEDYTAMLSVDELAAGRRSGRFAPEPDQI